MTSNLDWALPQGLEVPRDELLIRLDIYTSSLLLHTYEQGVTTTKQVSPADVALALSRDLQVASGLLPADTLWWKNSRNGQFGCAMLSYDELLLIGSSPTAVTTHFQILPPRSPI